MSMTCTKTKVKISVLFYLHFTVSQAVIPPVLLSDGERCCHLNLLSGNRSTSHFLQRIGQDRQCSESVISDMEAFTCAIYGNAATKSVNKLRYDTFMMKYQDRLSVLNVSNGMDMSLFPPCQSSFEMHIRRVNYQVFVWLHAHENNPDLPDIEESGWEIHGEEINYDWVKGDLIVPEQLVDILCDQRTIRRRMIALLMKNQSLLAWKMRYSKMILMKMIESRINLLQLLNLLWVSYITKLIFLENI